MNHALLEAKEAALPELGMVTAAGLLFAVDGCLWLQLPTHKPILLGIKLYTWFCGRLSVGLSRSTLGVLARQ